jgi:two-component system response regulator HydG
VTKHAQILIADDDPRVLLILRTTLERMKNGYRIVAARDGTEALQKVTAQPFDLVITDVRMPGIDGIELVQAIRASTLNTAVIWITAYGCHRLQAECDRLDVYRCLDKPLRIGEIRKAALGALETNMGPERTEK